MVRACARDRLHARHAPFGERGRGGAEDEARGGAGEVGEAGDGEVFVVDGAVCISYEYLCSVRERAQHVRVVEQDLRRLRPLSSAPNKARCGGSDRHTFLTTGSTQGLFASSRYAPTPRLTFCGYVSALYAAVSLKILPALHQPRALRII